MLGNLHHLIIHDTVHVGNRCQESQQVRRDVIAVDGSGKIRPDERRKVDNVHVDEVHRFHHPVTKIEVFIRTLEVLHRERPFLEVEGHEAVEVFVHLLAVELMVPDTSLRQYVKHLADLHMEVQPHLRVVFDKGTLDSFLGDDQVCRYFRVGPSLIVPEITLREERHALCYLMVVVLLAENVLLLQGIPFAKSLDDVVQYVRIGKILVGIRTVLLDWVLHLNDNRTVTLVGKQHCVQVVPLFILHIL